MPSTISAGTTAGTAIAITGDTTGNLAFQTNGTTTAMTINTSQNVQLNAAAGKILNSSGNPILQQTGSVLQVVSTTSTTLFSSTATSPIDITGFSVTITPTSATSKILIMFSCVGSATNSLNLYLNRNGTNISLGSGGSLKNATITSIPTASTVYAYSYSANFLDSPATTSSITYKVQGDTDAGTFYINRRGNDTLFASPATITVMEIAA